MSEIADKYYIENFLTRDEADRLLIFALGLPPTRDATIPWGHPASFVGLRNYSEFSSIDRYGRDNKPGFPLDTAPGEVKHLESALSEFAGKHVNCLSFIAYMNERDYMGFHQHDEDRIRLDQSVWVVSLAAVRAVTVRPIGCTDKRKYETIYPAHGSLYILPSAYNTTHEHEVSSSKTPCGIRVGINCKHFPAPQESHLILSAEAAGPRVYECRAGKKYPADAVYVGREVRDRRTGKVSWPATPFGNYKKLNGDAFRVYAADKMKDPEFRKQVESLRGRHLLCWCKPSEAANCHARIWLELANR
jgi:hypothetical protein